MGWFNWTFIKASGPQRVHYPGLQHPQDDARYGFLEFRRKGSCNMRGNGSSDLIGYFDVSSTAQEYLLDLYCKCVQFHLISYY